MNWLIIAAGVAASAACARGPSSKAFFQDCLGFRPDHGALRNLVDWLTMRDRCAVLQRLHGVGRATWRALLCCQPYVRLFVCHVCGR